MSNVAMSFYLFIAILCAEILCANRALKKSDDEMLPDIVQHNLQHSCFRLKCHCTLWNNPKKYHLLNVTEIFLFNQIVQLSLEQEFLPFLLLF